MVSVCTSAVEYNLHTLLAAVCTLCRRDHIQVAVLIHGFLAAPLLPPTSPAVLHAQANKAPPLHQAPGTPSWLLLAVWWERPVGTGCGSCGTCCPATSCTTDDMCFYVQVQVMELDVVWVHGWRRGGTRVRLQPGLRYGRRGAAGTSGHTHRNVFTCTRHIGPGELPLQQTSDDLLSHCGDNEVGQCKSSTEWWQPCEAAIKWVAGGVPC